MFDLKLHNPPLEREELCHRHGKYTSVCAWGTQWTMCPICEQELAAKLEADRLAKRAKDWARLWHRNCPARYRDAALSSRVPEQSEAVAAAKNLAQSLRGHLILLGPVGVGKTHLACAAAGRLAIESGKIPSYTTVSEACDMAANYQTRQDFRVLKMAPLLVLDEVPAALDEKSAAVIFDLFDARYRGRRCNIICANLSLAELSRVLGARIIDRLRDDGARVIVMQGNSLRVGN